MRRLLLLLIYFSLTIPALAAYHTPYAGSRIFWDNATRKTVFSSGGYARILELQDGRLMAVCESSGINISFSTDNGSTWSDPEKIVTNTNNVPNCVPDLIQLTDGTIIVAYNPRPSTPYTQDRRFGIRCKRSTDDGKTWSDEIKVYDASWQWNDGCWEPSMLQLPTGELELYFADESPYTSSSEQQISMCRSSDGGKTWTEPQCVSFRKGYRDGMPTAILLSDQQTIALCFEDNGWSGVNGFIPSIVTCPLSTDWVNYWVGGDSSNRWKAVNYDYCTLHAGGAPYLRMLPNGETVLSHQGEDTSGSGKYLMWTYIGNKEAKDFKAMSAPFGTSEAYWNSVAIIDSGTIVAVGGIDGKIEMIKGRPVNHLVAPYAHPAIDGKQLAADGYYTTGAKQMLLGHSSDKTRFTADFAYDDDSLYFTSRVSDITPNVVHSSYCDGVTLFLDTKDSCEEYPVNDIYRLFFRLDSICVCYTASAKHRWTATSLPGIHYVVRRLARFYTVEAAIPWSSLGFKKVPVESSMRVNVMLQDNQGNNNIVTDMMPDAKRDASWTWMSFSLLPHAATSISQVKNQQTFQINRRKDELFFSAPVKQVSVYTIDGRLIALSNVPTSSLHCSSHYGW